jgi:hypothetical protein
MFFVLSRYYLYYSTTVRGVLLSLQVAGPVLPSICYCADGKVPVLTVVLVPRHTHAANPHHNSHYIFYQDTSEVHLL